jgi:hypothetical protein
VREVILNHGLFSSLYTDRGRNSRITPEAGGKVDKVNLTQFGRVMKHLGIEMLPAYSPEARGRELSGPLPSIRVGYSRSWRRSASRHCKRPIAIWRKSIAPPSTPSSSNRRWSKVLPSCRGSGALWTTSSASSMSAP